VETAQVEFDDRLARMLDGMANRIDGAAPGAEESLEDSLEGLEQTVRSYCLAGAQGPLTAEVQAFLDLSRNIASVTMLLDREIESVHVVQPGSPTM
jgi:multidrug resistance protein MdtO